MTPQTKRLTPEGYVQPSCQLYNEDCIETMKRIETGSIDLLLQDTPFGCTQNEWDIKPSFPVMWQEWERIIKDNGAMIFFGTQPFASELILSRSGFFRYDLIWYKALGTGFLNANKMPMRNHEHILVFYKMQPTYNPQIFDKPKQNIRPITTKPRLSDNYGKFKEGNTRTIPIDKSYPDSVLYFDNESKTETEHPTQKPVGLYDWIFTKFAEPGMKVLDTHLGSGSSRIAAHKNKLNFVGFEIDKEYYDKQEKRFADYVSQLTLF